MKKIIEVLRLHLKLNLSLRQSATLSKISLGTASNYVNRFKEINIDIDKFISLNEIEQEKLFYPKNVVGTQRIWPARAFTLGHLTHNDLASVRIAKRATKSL